MRYVFCELTSFSGIAKRVGGLMQLSDVACSLNEPHPEYDMSYWKHLLLMGLVATVISLGILTHHVLSPTPGVSLRNFRLLRVGWETGMIDKEAQDLLGGPGRRRFRVTGRYFRQWNTGEISVHLRFAEGDCRLEGGHFTNHVTGFEESLPDPVWEPQEAFLEKIRRLLGL